jgi:hypothetical protein
MVAWRQFSVLAGGQDCIRPEVKKNNLVLRWVNRAQEEMEREIFLPNGYNI